MDINKFWELIDTAREESGGWEEMFLPLVERLSGLEVRDIMMWFQIFQEYQQLSYKQKLWAAAYVINGGCSDDGFDYFRGWLTAQGKEVFMAALKDPDSLAEVDSCEEEVAFEEMLSIGASAYFNKMGIQRDYDRFYEELDRYPLPEKLKKTMLDEIKYDKDIDADWEEEGDSLNSLLPNLCEAFDW